jgi:shikimate dehydrogenase
MLNGKGTVMLETLSGETLLYPIIGDPILFVKAPQRLTAMFEARNHNGICVPMQVPDGGLNSVLRGLGAIPNVRGLLITMPHKNTMFTCCATSS